MYSQILTRLQCFLQLALLASTGTLSHVALAEDSIFDTGMAITPENFPHHSASDLDDAFRLAAELGKYSVFIFQWHELDIDIVKLMMDKSSQAGLIPGLSPTSLD